MKPDISQILKSCLLIIVVCSTYSTYSQLIAEGEEAQKLFDAYYDPIINARAEAPVEVDERTDAEINADREEYKFFGYGDTIIKGTARR